jgi:CBS-domain-containing membrane protein
MHATRTLHPPGGATALIAIIGSHKIHALGWLYVVIPATVGPLALLLVAVLVNNIPKTRRYPEIWF